VERKHGERRSKMKTTGKYSTKRFKCTRCGLEQLSGTNHWGEFYDRCNGCSWKNPMDPIVTWKCLEPMPEGFEAPAPWRKVTLGDICEIITVKGGRKI
jgi:hypothetical protein